MGDAIEWMLSRQLLGTGDSWTQAVFLAGVFLVLLFRRDQIVSLYLFRVSVILFALSLILPVVMTGILQMTMTRSGGTLPTSGEFGGVMQILMTTAGPVLLGLAIVFCVVSMLPPQSRYPGPPDRPPQPHPLD